MDRSPRRAAIHNYRQSSASFSREVSIHERSDSPNQGSESRDSLSPICMALGPPAPSVACAARSRTLLPRRFAAAHRGRPHAAARGGLRALVALLATSQRCCSSIVDRAGHRGGSWRSHRTHTKCPTCAALHSYSLPAASHIYRTHLCAQLQRSPSLWLSPSTGTWRSSSSGGNGGRSSREEEELPHQPVAAAAAAGGGRGPPPHRRRRRTAQRNLTPRRRIQLSGG